MLSNYPHSPNYQRLNSISASSQVEEFHDDVVEAFEENESTQEDDSKDVGENDSATRKLINLYFVSFAVLCTTGYVRTHASVLVLLYFHNNEQTCYC